MIAVNCIQLIILNTTYTKVALFSAISDVVDGCWDKHELQGKKCWVWLVTIILITHPWCRGIIHRCWLIHPRKDPSKQHFTTMISPGIVVPYFVYSDGSTHLPQRRHIPNVHPIVVSRCRVNIHRYSLHHPPTDRIIAPYLHVVRPSISGPYFCVLWCNDRPARRETHAKLPSWHVSTAWGQQSSTFMNIVLPQTGSQHSTATRLATD